MFTKCVYLSFAEWRSLLADMAEEWRDLKEDYNGNFKNFVYSYFDTIVSSEDVDCILAYIENELVEIYNEEKFYEEVMKYLRKSAPYDFSEGDPFAE